jgi:hypothetical protein
VPTFIQALAPYLPLSADVTALLVLLVAVPLFIAYTVRAMRGRGPAVRPIATYERLERLVNQAAESGRPLHVALGTGTLGEPDTAETLAGLTALDFVARRAAVWGQPVVASTGDGATLPAAQGLWREGLEEAGYPEQYGASALHFYGPAPLAYSAGASALGARREAAGTLLLGRFGVEGLWLSEAEAGAEQARLGGTAQPDAAALLTTSLDDAVHGEEVFAAGAYLHRPSHLGSLATEDALRVLVVVAILGGVVLASLGWLG